MASDTRKESISSSTSAVRQTSNPDDDVTGGIKFKDWGFQVEKLFQVAYRFYKRNESKAFHLTFDERNQMNALVLQAKFGNYDSKKAPDIGTLDFVGKNRHYHWSLLAGMSKTEAMSNFICNLDRLCPLFKAHAEAVKISSENATLSRYPSQQYDSQSSQNSSMTSSSINQSFDESKSYNESSEQLKAIHTSLCKQTYEQFKSYAKKEHPNDVEQQKSLLSALQEQYYHQYISQMHPELSNQTRNDSNNPANGVNIEPPKMNNGTNTTTSSSNNNNNNNNNQGATPVIDPAKSEATKDDVFVDVVIGPASPQQGISSYDNFPSEAVQNVAISPGKEENSNQAATRVFYIEPLAASSATPTTSQDKPPAPRTQLQSSLQQNPPSSSSAHVIVSEQEQSQVCKNANPRTEEEDLQNKVLPSQVNVAGTRHVVDTWDCDSSSSSNGVGSPLKQTISYEPLEAATSWTKRGVCEFKDSLINDKQGGSYTISQGVILIIEVPTYPEGRYIHWEFATDDYDIGFGVDFVFETRRPLGQPLAMNIYERDDEDDDEDEEDIPEDIEAMASRLDQEQANYDVELAGQHGRQGSAIESLEEANPMLATRSELIRRRAERIERENNTISILPTYRRDSHEEVHAGRHKYPGQGYYMLKFDNTYSMLRSKSLYYRICYFI